MDFEKGLKNIIKVAGVALTSPATWDVAGRLYDNPFQRVLVQLAALTLVEGILILGWWKLDNDRQSEIPQRILYASFAGVAYIALWVIALAHGEGAAGLTFRLTLLVALVYSMFEAGILASIRLRKAKERNPFRYWKVRRARKKAEIAAAIKQIEIDTEEKMKNMSAKSTAKSHKDTPRTISAKSTRTIKRRGSRIDTDRLPGQIAEKLAEHPNATQKEIAGMLNISESTLYKYKPTNGHREEVE